jgi:hypothetical protein
LDDEVIDAEFTEDGEGFSELRPDPQHDVHLDTALVLAADLMPTQLVEWDGSSVASAAAEACIARFAAAEADVSSADLGGLGRTSGVRFPRLGGVLHGRIEPGSPEAELLRSAVARTIRAAYHLAESTEQVAKQPISLDGLDDLWPAFVANSYRVPRRVAASAWDVCRFDDFWVGVLEQLGFEGDASRFANGHVSALSRSIRGLSTVGMMLALVERGGRHDRLQSARLRPGRTSRSLRRSAPRPPLRPSR